MRPFAENGTTEESLVNGGRSTPAKSPQGSSRSRRDVLIAGTGALISAAIADPNEADAAKPPERLPLQAGDRVQLIKGDLKDQFVKPELLEVSAKPLEAFPFDPAANVIRRKWRLNRLLVVRLDPAEMDPPTRERSVDGILVYSALCTHRTCTIKSWKQEERILRCHCHLSEFAALSEGSVLSGPARRQLPMVPLALDDEGFIVATDTFTRKPGGAKK